MTHSTRTEQHRTMRAPTAEHADGTVQHLRTDLTDVPSTESAAAWNPRYTELGIRQGWNPTPFDQLRIWVTGVGGSGKTTFISSDPGSLILDFDYSANDVPTSRAAYVSCPDVRTMQHILDRVIKDGPGTSGFKRIVFDTMDRLCELVIEFLTEEYNRQHPDTRVDSILGAPHASYSAGYTAVVAFMVSLLESIRGAGYGWTVTSHVDEREIMRNNRREYVNRPLLFSSLRSALYRVCQFQCEMERVWIEERVESGKARLNRRTGKREPVMETRTIPAFFLNYVDMKDLPTHNTKQRYVQHLPGPGWVAAPAGLGMSVLEGLWNNALKVAGSPDTEKVKTKTHVPPRNNEDTWALSEDVDDTKETMQGDDDECKNGAGQRGSRTKSGRATARQRSGRS